jgi:mRNA interferase HicA
MKRIDFIRHLEANGCEFFREGSKHTVYVNRSKRTSSTVPRHREVNEYLTRKICRDLQIPDPAKSNR